VLGETLASAQRYARTVKAMAILRTLLNSERSIMMVRSGNFGSILAASYRWPETVRSSIPVAFPHDTGDAGAKGAAASLFSKPDTQTSAAIRARSLNSPFTGVQPQTVPRGRAGYHGSIDANPMTGIDCPRSDPDAVILGDPDQVLAKATACREAGTGAFIVSGYPRADKEGLLVRRVLRHLEHGPLA